MARPQGRAVKSRPRAKIAARARYAAPMMWTSILAISLGAALGALLRWQLAVWLNALVPNLPPGTLVANLLGGFLMGLALALFAARPELGPEWRLLVITGFLGGLTTFSAFSGEVVLLLQEGKTAWALATITAHVVGSLLMTLLGLAAASALRAGT